MTEAVTMITSHNARLAHIRKFVMVPPARGRTLRLVTCEEPPSVIGEWTRDECTDNSATAVDVDETLREHTQTMQEDITATLAWQDEQHQVVRSKRLRCPFENQSLDPATAAQAEALGITGTQQGWMMQAQLILERKDRLYTAANQTLLQTAMGMIHQLGGMVQESFAQQAKLHVELDRLRTEKRSELDEVLEELRAAQGDAPISPEAEAKAELLAEAGKALTQALPMVLAGVIQRLATAPASPGPDRPRTAGSSSPPVDAEVE